MLQGEDDTGRSTEPTERGQGTREEKRGRPEFAMRRKVAASSSSSAFSSSRTGRRASPSLHLPSSPPQQSSFSSTLRILVVGDAGSGKSTFLQNLCRVPRGVRTPPCASAPSAHPSRGSRRHTASPRLSSAFSSCDSSSSSPPPPSSSDDEVPPGSSSPPLLSSVCPNSQIPRQNASYQQDGRLLQGERNEEVKTEEAKEEVKVGAEKKKKGVGNAYSLPPHCVRETKTAPGLRIKCLSSRASSNSSLDLPLPSLQGRGNRQAGDKPESFPHSTSPPSSQFSRDGFFSSSSPPPPLSSGIEKRNDTKRNDEEKEENAPEGSPLSEERKKRNVSDEEALSIDGVNQNKSSLENQRVDGNDETPSSLLSAPLSAHENGHSRAFFSPRCRGVCTPTTATSAASSSFSSSSSRGGEGGLSCQLSVFSPSSSSYTIRRPHPSLLLENDDEKNRLSSSSSFSPSSPYSAATCHGARAPLDHSAVEDPVRRPRDEEEEQASRVRDSFTSSSAPSSPSLPYAADDQAEQEEEDEESCSRGGGGGDHYQWTCGVRIFHLIWTGRHLAFADKDAREKKRPSISSSFPNTKEGEGDTPPGTRCLTNDKRRRRIRKHLHDHPGGGGAHVLTSGGRDSPPVPTGSPASSLHSSPPQAERRSFPWSAARPATARISCAPSPSPRRGSFSTDGDLKHTRALPPRHLRGGRSMEEEELSLPSSASSVSSSFLVEFWEVGGTKALEFVRGLIYTQEFDGVWLCFDSSVPESFVDLARWAKELCTRRCPPSAVLFSPPPSVHAQHPSESPLLFSASFHSSAEQQRHDPSGRPPPPALSLDQGSASETRDRSSVIREKLSGKRGSWLLWWSRYARGGSARSLFRSAHSHSNRCRTSSQVSLHHKDGAAGAGSSFLPERTISPHEDNGYERTVVAGHRRTSREAGDPSEIAEDTETKKKRESGFDSLSGEVPRDTGEEREEDIDRGEEKGERKREKEVSGDEEGQMGPPGFRLSSEKDCSKKQTIFSQCIVEEEDGEELALSSVFPHSPRPPLLSSLPQDEESERLIQLSSSSSCAGASSYLAPPLFLLRTIFKSLSGRIAPRNVFRAKQTSAGSSFSSSSSSFSTLPSTKCEEECLEEGDLRNRALLSSSCAPPAPPRRPRYHSCLADPPASSPPPPFARKRTSLSSVDAASSSASTSPPQLHSQTEENLSDDLTVKGEETQDESSVTPVFMTTVRRRGNDQENKEGERKTSSSSPSPLTVLHSASSSSGSSHPPPQQKWSRHTPAPAGSLFQKEEASLALVRPPIQSAGSLHHRSVRGEAKGGETSFLQSLREKAKAYLVTPYQRRPLFQGGIRALSSSRELGGEDEEESLVEMIIGEGESGLDALSCRREEEEEERENQSIMCGGGGVSLEAPKNLQMGLDRRGRHRDSREGGVKRKAHEGETCGEPESSSCPLSSSSSSSSLSCRSSSSSATRDKKEEGRRGEEGEKEGKRWRSPSEASWGKSSGALSEEEKRTNPREREEEQREEDSCFSVRRRRFSSSRLGRRLLRGVCPVLLIGLKADRVLSNREAFSRSSSCSDLAQEKAEDASRPERERERKEEKGCLPGVTEKEEQEEESMHAQVKISSSTRQPLFSWHDSQRRKGENKERLLTEEEEEEDEEESLPCPSSSSSSSSFPTHRRTDGERQEVLRKRLETLHQNRTVFNVDAFASDRRGSFFLLSRVFFCGGLSALKTSLWERKVSRSEDLKLKRVLCHLLNSAPLLFTSSRLGEEGGSGGCCSSSAGGGGEGGGGRKEFASGGGSCFVEDMKILDAFFCQAQLCRTLVRKVEQEERGEDEEERLRRGEEEVLSCDLPDGEVGGDEEKKDDDHDHEEEEEEEQDYVVFQCSSYSPVHGGAKRRGEEERGGEQQEEESDSAQSLHRSLQKGEETPRGGQELSQGLLLSLELKEKRADPSEDTYQACRSDTCSHCRRNTQASIPHPSTGDTSPTSGVCTDRVRHHHSTADHTKKKIDDGSVKKLGRISREIEPGPASGRA